MIPDYAPTSAGPAVARRTTTTLADGRRLIYFDESDGADRSALDSRPLPVTTTASQIRHDPVRDDWVVIASHRQDRTYHPPADECPLCPSRDGHHTEIPASSYDVVVFENRFPSLSTHVAAPAPEPAVAPGPDCHRNADAEQAPGIGRCEVVCFTDDHHTSFGQLSTDRVRTVLEAWADRTSELCTIDGVELVFPFENRGEEIGVTLAHPHGQIYAYPFVPNRIRRRLASARAHRERTGSCLWCVTIDDELAAKERIVAQNERWVAFVPFAARWPYEVHLLPRRHVPDIPALSPQDRDDFARIYLDVLAGMEGLFDSPTPYISAWQQAPVHSGREENHLSLEVFSIRRARDKLKYLAGSESGMGVFINDIAPERAAAALRGEQVS